MKITLRFKKNLVDDNGRNLLGFTYKNGKKVLIRKGLFKREVFEVLVHEFTHVALVLSKIRVTNDQHEKIAYRVGACATSVLKEVK